MPRKNFQLPPETCALVPSDSRLIPLGHIPASINHSRLESPLLTYAWQLRDGTLRRPPPASLLESYDHGHFDLFCVNDFHLNF